MATSSIQLTPTAFKALPESPESPSLVSFVPFTLPSTNQRTLGAPHAPGTVIPLALRATATPTTATQTAGPSSSSSSSSHTPAPLSHSQEEPISLDSAVETVRTLQKDGILTKLLAQHGAVLLRNLPIHSAEDFSKLAHAFNFRPHEIIGIVVDRPLLAPNVAPANESAPHVVIYNHNESPQVPHAPEYIMFYSHVAPKPGSGGETPLSSSLELFHRAQQQMPEFIEALASKGVQTRISYKFTKQYDGGSTLKQTFGKEIEDGDDENTRRTKIEAQIRRYGRTPEDTKWEWTDDGIILTHRLPAIRTQQSTGLPTLFTSLAAFYKISLINQAAGRGAVTSQLYGDGTEIPVHYLKTLADITDEIRVLHQWQRGDVLVFDNVVAQHGRQPWVGEQKDRVVLASLWDGESPPGRYEKSHGSWARVVKAADDS